MRNIVKTIICQVCVLLYKNFKIRLASPALAFEIVISSLAVLVAFLFTLVHPEMNSAELSNTLQLGKCQPAEGAACVTVAYHPSTPDTDKLMEILANQTGLVMGKDIVSTQYNDTGFLSYCFQNPNETQSGVFFDTDPHTGSLKYPGINYKIIYNNTQVCSTRIGGPGCFQWTNNRFQLQAAVDQALFSFYSVDSKLSIAVESESSTEVSSEQSESAMSPIILTLVALGIIAPLVLTVDDIVAEKDLGFRSYLTASGLLQSSWVFGTIADQGIFRYILPYTLMIGMGYACGLSIFRDTNFSIVLIVFSADAITIFTSALLLSSFISSKNVSVIAGFCLFAVYLIIVTICTGFGDKSMLLWEDPVWGYLACALPMVSMGMLWSTVLTMQGQDQSLISHPSNYDYAPSILFYAFYLCAASIIMFFASIYFENIIPRHDQIGKSWWYPFQPSFWGFATSPKNIVDSKPVESVLLEEIDECALKEKKLAEEGISCQENPPAVVLYELRKEYAAGGFMGWVKGVFRKEQSKVNALTGLNLVANAGEITVILGENGSGKTTAMKIISGLLKPAGGAVRIFGTEINSQDIGILPQQDILFDQLSPMDHLWIFGSLKSGWFSERFELEQLLNDIKLYDVRHKKCGQFSGGMRRRLCIGLATVGNPRVVLMDEPTTGIDVANQRNIWDLILRMKKNNCSFLISSHNMLEAESLADKIVFMKAGRLKAAGSVAELKQKYAVGMRLSVTTTPWNVAELIHTIPKICTDTTVVTGSGSTICFNVRSKLSEQTGLFQYLKEGKQFASSIPIVTDWFVSSCTLEDCFISLNKYS